MINIKQVFQNSERIKTSANLWQNIEAKVDLKANPSRGKIESQPLLKMAACLVLSAGIIGMVLNLGKRSRAVGPVEAGAAAKQVLNSTETILDPELLVWDADLGELEDWVDYENYADESAEEGEIL